MLNLSELLHWSEYSKLLIGLLAISDPLTSLPMFLGLTEGLSRSRKRKVFQVAVLAYALLLLAFTYFGESILGVFGIQLSAFKVAGGILLLLSALEMMQSHATPDAINQPLSQNPISIGIAPLAIPSLAGPGAISTVIIYAHTNESFTHQLLVTLVILSASAVIYGVFATAVRVGKFLNQTTSTAMSRIMGLINASLGVEFILDGISAHFPQIF